MRTCVLAAMPGGRPHSCCARRFRMIGTPVSCVLCSQAAREDQSISAPMRASCVCVCVCVCVCIICTCNTCDTCMTCVHVFLCSGTRGGDGDGEPAKLRMAREGLKGQKRNAGDQMQMVLLCLPGQRMELRSFDVPQTWRACVRERTVRWHARSSAFLCVCARSRSLSLC